MTEALVALSLVAVACFGVWLALREARGRGQVEAELDASRDAREVEQEMTDVMLEPTSPDKTKDKLRKGEF